jgi:hypothetical protein
MVLSAVISSEAGEPHDGVQEVAHLDVNSAVRKARRTDFEIANTFVPARTLAPPRADPV